MAQSPSQMLLITLLTDFGLVDTYVGQMKAAIANIAPKTRVIDLTHHVPAQDILAGAITLADAITAFDRHAIHIAVVDPGVGTNRQPIAIRCDLGTFIGPDNGLFSFILAQNHPIQAVVLDNPAYHRKAVSNTFHGRDIFATAAAHLAAGVAFETLGSPIDPAKLCRLQLPAPRIQEDVIQAQVLHADHFGNLLTNLMQCDFDRWQRFLDVTQEHVRVTLESPNITMPLVHAYAQVALHEPLAYFGSSGRLEIAIREGSAKSQWNTQRFEGVHVYVPMNK